MWKLCQNYRQIVTAAKAGDSLPELSKFATAVKAVDSLSQNLSKIGKTLMCLNQTLSRYQTNSTNLAFKVELGKSYLLHRQASSQYPPLAGTQPHSSKGVIFLVQAFSTPVIQRQPSKQEQLVLISTTILDISTTILNISTAILNASSR